MACIGTSSQSGLLAAGQPGTGSTGGACGFALSYTRGMACCEGNMVRIYRNDPCYASCDLPSSVGDDLEGYMRGCLAQNGETIDVLYCTKSGGGNQVALAGPAPTTDGGLVYDNSPDMETTSSSAVVESATSSSVVPSSTSVPASSTTASIQASSSAPAQSTSGAQKQQPILIQTLFALFAGVALAWR